MLKKELEQIVLKEKDIIPFLKKLNPKDKRELVPFLKKLKEKIFERYDVTEKTKWGMSYTTKPVHSEAKRNLVNKACYVCFNKTDTKKAFFNVSQLSVSDDYLENIIPWYIPKWYSNLINEDMPWELNYEKMMALYKKGLLEPSHALILARLPNAIVESKWENNKNRSFYRPEVLHKHKETLDDHIWFLFEEESGINNYYNYLHLENYKGGNDIWINTITYLVAENKLDRKKVLVATIYSSTKGFNKTLSGWFFDLLIKLNPSQDEVLSLQNEFFAALNSPHSKVINTVLKYFKLVANQKKFKHKVFIENASILLNSETKSVVNSTLMILDKIAKVYKSSSISICKKAAEALINVDEKIQLRAAKIIEKYGNPKKQELLEEVSLYADNLFHSSKEVLKEYIISNEEIEEESYEVEDAKLLSEENKLPTYGSLDDLIFFISQVIDNNEVYHIDLLLSYLPKLNVLLNKDNVAKLEPIFKRSLDLSMNFEGWNSQIGSLESEAAFYLNDFAEILMNKYPLELQSFKKTKDQKIKKLKKDRFYKSRYKENLKEIEYQSIPDYIYQIHHSLFIQSKSLIKKGLTLELLSTPTHAPCWVDPKVLIDRIISYEKRNEEINLFDFQIAIGRLPINKDTSDIFENIDKINDGDIKEVLKYHFDQLEIQNVNISRPELWLQSVLSKNSDEEITYFQEYLANPLQKEKGAYSWDCRLRDHFYKEYDYAAGKQVQKKMIRKELKYKDFNLQKNEPESLISSLKNVLNKKKKKIKISSIYEYMYFKKQKYYTTIQPNDDVKFLFLSPNNPSMFLSHVIHNNLKESTFFDESSKKNMVNLLKGIYEIWYRADFKESTYLFLSTGLLCSDKVARELAAEIWIKANSENKINNRIIGQILGKLESGEYAPLKRFTDLLTASLFKVSKRHNESLFTLLDNMIGNMNDEPIRGIKKLLELFLELKHTFPQIEISESTKDKLSGWKNSKTLKPVITNIEK
ncbi:DUF6493 family protein [Maribacter litoralis]|uniref:Uncharacterized protein n=1 Tax=Maribacter litoralis TaxID=2059726 RepID=A0A653RHE7_9FLAO|nr:DUF6493 family protein [Maribacter litoralis]VXB55064.1 conserved hypothetical protein [Maribacter litoralis]